MCNFQVTSNLNVSQQGKEFKQGYYRNIYTLRLCRPVYIQVTSNLEMSQGENGSNNDIIGTFTL